MPQIILRKAQAADFEQVLMVERLSTPRLQYLPFVFDQFLADQRGEFTVAELDGVIVACAKFTVLPDNSAWLETIRVAPQHQGLGIGKRFYENYFAIAKRESIRTMRMYTGVGNAASKGLAERFQFELAQSFHGGSLSTPVASKAKSHNFQSVSDHEHATQLIMPHADSWSHFLVMNRTFYKLTPVLCAYLADKGMVYANGDSMIVLGARFMPNAALHIGFFAGDDELCLQFAAQLAASKGIAQVGCLFPKSATAIQASLAKYGFQNRNFELIVMEHRSSRPALL